MNGIENIMVVEDEPSDFLLLRRALSKEWADAPVLWMRDGIHAIDYLRGGGQYGDREKFPMPTLVILDLKLPRLGGLELLEWMGTEPTTTRLPVVVISGSTDPVDASRAYALGARSFFAKPATLAELEALVRSARELCERCSESSETEASDAT